MCACFCFGHMCSFFLSIYLGVKLLDYMITICFNFQELPNCLPKLLCHFIFSKKPYDGCNISKSSPRFVIIFLIIAILVSITWYLIVVLICISLMMMLSIFLCAYWLHEYLLWRNVYSAHLPIFIYLLIMLLQLSYFPTFIPLHAVHLLLPTFPTPPIVHVYGSYI